MVDSKRSRSNSPNRAESCFVRLSNCGASAAESDVRSFFVAGVEIEAVGPNESGSILVKCANAKSAQAALAFDQKQLCGNQVQVRRASSQNQIGASGPKEQAALRMQGLPFKATEEEIEEFF